MTLPPGQIAVYNPQHVHMTVSEHSEPIPYYNLHLDTAWCLKIQQEIFPQIQHFLPLETLILQKPAFGHSLRLLFALIRTEDSHTIEPLLKAFIKDIFARHCTPATDQKNESQLLHRVEQYILAHLDAPLGIEEIASEVGYNSAYINRLFKQHYGLTLHAFMVDKRIHKAKEHLLSPTSSPFA